MTEVKITILFNLHSPTLIIFTYKMYENCVTNNYAN